MRSAIVGAGLAGLAAGYYLKKQGHELTFFDRIGIGGGASGIAAGLFHPYPGKKGLLSKYAEEAYPHTIELLDAAEKALGKKVALRNGVMKGEWFIERGMTVFMDLYLQGLWKCLDAKLIKTQVTQFDTLDEFDCVVLALGGGFKEQNFDLPIQFVKGQALIVESDQTWERSVIGNGHISPTSDGNYQIGSTYEHHYRGDEPDLEVAKNYLKPRVETFLPPLDTFRILKCISGIRVARKGSYLPIVEQVNDRLFVFTGLGSRGLLYHAFYGLHLANMVGSAL